MSGDQLEGAVSHRRKNNQQTNENTTMSTKSNDNDLFDDEEHHDHHQLATMIGEAITIEDYGVHHSSGYILRKDEDGNIHIYREIEHAKTRDELETEGDYVADMYDYVLAGKDIGYIGAPEDGWESEVTSLPESIWGGF